jgi:sugar phosphate isomerase/epimerase
MKLGTSTGDFTGYVDSIEEEIKNFRNSKFRYINLEQVDKSFEQDGDEWRRKVDAWGEAAAYAGVSFLASHSPCVNAYSHMDEQTYQVALRAIRRSIEACHILGIPSTVVHASSNVKFSYWDFWKKNKRFYTDLFDLMEKYNVMVLTENMHEFAYFHLSTGKEMREFIDYIDHPLFAACWDTAHGNLNRKARERGQYQCITEIGDKLKGLHISDNFGDGPHHHTWPFAGVINFDSVLQGLVDVGYDGPFTFEASYTLLHATNLPYRRKAWEHNGETVTKLHSPSIALKKQAIDLLYETGKYMLQTYDCYEE